MMSFRMPTFLIFLDRLQGGFRRRLRLCGGHDAPRSWARIHHPDGVDMSFDVLIEQELPQPLTHSTETKQVIDSTATKVF